MPFFSMAKAAAKRACYVFFTIHNFFFSVSSFLISPHSQHEKCFVFRLLFFYQLKYLYFFCLGGNCCSPLTFLLFFLILSHLLASSFVIFSVFFQPFFSSLCLYIRLTLPTKFNIHKDLPRGKKSCFKASNLIFNLRIYSVGWSWEGRNEQKKEKSEDFKVFFRKKKRKVFSASRTFLHHRLALLKSLFVVWAETSPREKSWGIANGKF